MIDFHSHILPCIDDGAKSIEESFEMATCAFNKGINKIIATPHYIHGETNYSIQEIFKKVDDLNNLLKAKSIDLEVLPGQEVYLTPEIPSMLRDKKIITLGDKGKYLLIELPMNDYPTYTDSVLFEVMLQGVIPVIAHPERNRALAKHPSMFYRLISKGIVSQANVGSFYGKYGERAKDAAELFLKHNYTHFFGFDAHSVNAYDCEIPVLFENVPNETKFMENRYVSTSPKEIQKRKKLLGIF